MGPVMSRLFRWTFPALAAILTGVLLPAAPTHAATYSAPLCTAAAGLTVAAENRAGYALDQ